MVATNLSHQFLLDTDILIDYLRGQTKAVAYLENINGLLLVSVITVAELFAGVREGDERVTLEQFINLFEIISVEREIAELGGIYRRDYGAKHGTGLADALIAATAKHKRVPLITLNARHFPMLQDVIIPYKKT
jgi:predicted nucleic acid-binding protein